jgi:hypothetical protein
MISRCKYCGDIAPDGSTICDTCCYIESEDGNIVSVGDFEDEIIQED